MQGRLHLVGELGFSTDERACRRAGLDYWTHLDWTRQESLEALRAALPGRLIAFSTRGEELYTEVDFRPGDCLLFGDELKGLPAEALKSADLAVRIPLRNPAVRSLNLANSVAIAVSEVLRQQGHPDALPAKSPAAHAEASKKATLTCKPN